MVLSDFSQIGDLIGRTFLSGIHIFTETACPPVGRESLGYPCLGTEAGKREAPRCEQEHRSAHSTPGLRVMGYFPILPMKGKMSNHGKVNFLGSLY
jgi:hypothetical protein